MPASFSQGSSMDWMKRSRILLQLVSLDHVPGRCPIDACRETPVGWCTLWCAGACFVSESREALWQCCRSVTVAVVRWESRSLRCVSTPSCWRCCGIVPTFASR